MTRIKPVHYRKLLKVFEKSGWEYLGDKGDHMQLRKKGFTRRVVIPRRKDVPVFIIKNNLRTAEITREEYLLLL